MTLHEKLNKLKQIYRELTKLNQISCLLSWDQETYMPPLAAEGRAEQLAILAKIIHDKITSLELSDLLYEVYQNRHELSVEDRKFIEIKYCTWQKQNQLTPEFVATWSSLTSQAIEAWKTAKQKKDFDLFAPFLEQLIALVRTKTSLLGKPNNYDVLLDYYEPGLTKKQVDSLFTVLKTGIKQILSSLPQIGPTRS
jgi:carboxypeptidase Taq